MYRTNTCGELRLSDAGKEVTLAGWVQRVRKMGGMIFADLRDRYGITQLVFNDSDDSELCARASKLGREFCIQVKGTVNERESKNANLPTGDVEIIVKELNVLSPSATPPFTIEDNTDGGDDIRMKYRYLDLRRPMVRKNLELRHRMTILIRNFLDAQNFIEVETPILIGSTPEGARDFVVPSRMNPGQFYALPQSPQTLKQLLMVSGFDRYFQIAKCFRDEDLRADRQPEFTQIDCEMSFVDQDDVINLFEDMYHLLEHTHGECARTASWIENLTTVERLHNRQLLLFGEHGFAVGIGKQLTIFVLQVITNRAFEVSDKTFIDHILHNLARSIERTRLFSGGLLRFGVVRRQQILEYFTEQFRVKRHILIKGHIFFHSEVIAFENINDTTSRYLLLVGISVEIREVNVLARFLTKEKIVWHNQLCH